MRIIIISAVALFGAVAHAQMQPTDITPPSAALPLPMSTATPTYSSTTTPGTMLPYTSRTATPVQPTPPPTTATPTTLGGVQVNPNNPNLTIGGLPANP